MEQYMVIPSFNNIPFSSVEITRYTVTPHPNKHILFSYHFISTSFLGHIQYNTAIPFSLLHDPTQNVQPLKRKTSI